jgi:TP901 family phage tail tape measure protein
MAEKIEFQLSVSKDDLNAALASATDEAKKTEKAIFRLSDAFSNASDELSRIKSSFIGNLGANAVSGAFSLLKSAIGETVTQAREYSKAIAEVNSILPKNQKLTEDQIQTFIKLSSLYGKDAQSEAKAFYEIVSGGVEDTATAFKILKQANEAATAGLTDVNVAAKVLTSTFNAFAQQGTTVNQITDSLFQAVKDGQTTFNELSNSLGRVAPIAASVGVRIDEVAGSIAFLTKSGVQTDQAITGLRTTLAAIIKPTKEAADEARRLGISFGADAIKQAGGFANFLNQIRVATNGSSTSIARLFGDVNAINTVIAIANGNFQDFTKTLDTNRKSTGATALAAKELKDSFDFKAGQAEQSIKNLATSFSVFLLPALQTTLNGFKALTGIGNVTVELDENRKKLSELALEYNKTKSALDVLKNAQGASDRQLQESLKIVGSVADGEKRLNEILLERTKIRQGIKAPTVKGDEPIVDPVVDPLAEAESLKLRQETFQKLALARAEFDAAEQERKLLSIEQGDTEGQVEFDKLLEFEQKKIDAKFLAEEQKNSLIKDALAKRQAIESTDLRKQKELADASLKIQFNKTQAQNKLEQQSLQTRLGYLQAFGNLASAIAKDGSKEQFLIQKAAAIAQSIVSTQLAASQALAVPPAPNFPLAATAKTIGNINTAAIVATAIKGFEQGGIVGATNGPDNQLASIRTGELVLNAEQQKNLFNAINSGNLGGGDIVVQIDGREIAKAVRSQLNAGFRLA